MSDKGTSPPLLSRRQLNRATLERQLLLRRATHLAPLHAVRPLVGMQAQVPLNPYHGLWSRLEGFRPESLAQLLLDRMVVRIVVMRGTLHLVTAEDCLLLRPLAQPVLDKELARHPLYGPALRGVDLEPALAYAREVLAEQPRTGGQLRAAFAERFPDVDPAALAYACRNHLAFIQVPPRGVWGRTGGVRSTTAEAWLGRPVEEHPSIDDVMLRYLGAFGPASVADAATWSRFTGLREVFERLRPWLRTFRDERGRELFDLPDAPCPDPDVPAPPRFLPEYDNVLLSHDDRSRFVSDEHRPLAGGGPEPVHGCVLVDGLVRATWSREDGTLTVRHAGDLGPDATEELEAEGLQLLRFLTDDAGDYEVRFTSA